MNALWYVYMVRCFDGTLYTGITTDVTRRVAEHNGEGRPVGAKYTKTRRPVELVYHEVAMNRSTASQREAKLRRLPRTEKLRLIDC